MRPSPEKFLDNTAFKIKKFQTLEKTQNWKNKKGGSFLGTSFMKKRKGKIFVLQDVINGIKN